MAPEYRAKSFEIYARQINLNMAAYEIAPRSTDGKVGQTIYTAMLKLGSCGVTHYETLATLLRLPLGSVRYQSSEDLTVEDRGVQLLLDNKSLMESIDREIRSGNKKPAERKPVGYVYHFAVEGGSEVARCHQSIAKLRKPKHPSDVVEQFFELARQFKLPDWDGLKNKKVGLTGDAVSEGRHAERLETVGVEQSDDTINLKQMAEEVLDSSDATLILILEHNKLPSDTKAVDLANFILHSNAPIEFLFNCIERDIAPDKRGEINASMSLLAGIVAPKCLTVDEFAELEAYLDDDSENRPHYVNINTADSMVARASVGYVKGLPIESREVNAFDKFLERRNKVGAVTPPPEFGAQYDMTKSETNRSIVDSFRLLLARFLGSPDELGRVKAALRSTAKLNVHFCVLFPNKLTPGQFMELKEEFPELILLLSHVSEEKESHYDALDQIKRVLEFFNAASKTS